MIRPTDAERLRTIAEREADPAARAELTELADRIEGALAAIRQLCGRLEQAVTLVEDEQERDSPATPPAAAFVVGHAREALGEFAPARGPSRNPSSVPPPRLA